MHLMIKMPVSLFERVIDFVSRTCYPCYDNERMIEEIIPKSSLYHPISFAIDSTTTIFTGLTAAIMQLSAQILMGLNGTVIINGSFGVGHLTIDQKNSLIYFMDDEVGSIERCTLDGDDQVTVISDSVMTKKSRISLGSGPVHCPVTEGESINITFTSTVPVGCISSHPVFRSQCDLNFYLSQPYYSASTCINNVIKRDIVFKTEFCGIRVGNLDWMEKRTLQVYGYNDGMYNINNRYAYLRLSTSSKYISTQNNIWRDVQINQITVQLYCYSRSEIMSVNFWGTFLEYWPISSPATFRNGWTSDGAYTICFNSINDALQNDMYKDYVDAPVDKFIEACVKDIEV
ncbi:unnamed protein product [Mytilus edulis]|uniref:Vwde helical domain-containing protein n=1 Tax=Mytilus edulis TaxID=6550 RepID=A0A8S3RRP3_MYTED|nr:unnamed protein product [Mytilus edulis]